MKVFFFFSFLSLVYFVGCFEIVASVSFLGEMDANGNSDVVGGK